MFLKDSFNFFIHFSVKIPQSIVCAEKQVSLKTGELFLDFMGKGSTSLC